MSAVPIDFHLVLTHDGRDNALPVGILRAMNGETEMELLLMLLGR